MALDIQISLCQAAKCNQGILKFGEKDDAFEERIFSSFEFGQAFTQCYDVSGL